MANCQFPNAKTMAKGKYPMGNDELEIREEGRRYDLSERLLAFAGLIIKIVRKMPATLVGKRIGDQLFRSGTSPGANYLPR